MFSYVYQNNKQVVYRSLEY